MGDSARPRTALFSGFILPDTLGLTTTGLIIKSFEDACLRFDKQNKSNQIKGEGMVGGKDSSGESVRSRNAMKSNTSTVGKLKRRTPTNIPTNSTTPLDPSVSSLLISISDP